MRKFFLFIGVLVVLIFTLSMYVVFSRSAPEKMSQRETSSQEETEEVVNPIENDIPNTSPTQNTNPFSDTYKNPFE